MARAVRVLDPLRHRARRGVNDTDSRYESLAYYYVRDRAGLVQTDAVEFTGSGVRALLFKALDVVGSRLDGEELQAALGFIRAAGGIGALLAPPNGPTNPDEILEARACQLAAAEVGPGPPDPLTAMLEREPTAAEVEYDRKFRAAVERSLADMRVREAAKAEEAGEDR